MPDPEPNHIENWADYIDALQVFNPPGLPRHRHDRNEAAAGQVDRADRASARRDRGDNARPLDKSRT